ncbi:MAG: hypothetical protein IKC91_00430 [Clostridia bacterium]|nr:hypothetical protein [Clostridia bacterium]
MMKISKLQTEISFPSLDAFVMQDTPVQGAKIGKADNALLIQSSKRYKLFTEGRDLVKVVEGEGFFKWKRGETKFCAQDVFEVCETGEYELNGKGVYIVIRG